MVTGVDGKDILDSKFTCKIYPKLLYVIISGRTEVETCEV